MDSTNFYECLEYREFKTLEFKRRLMVEYVRYMLDKTIPMFKYNNLPETIPERKLEEFIQTRGYVSIIDYAGDKRPKGFYAVTGGLGGERDAYYEPIDFVFANPYLGLDGSYRIYPHEPDAGQPQCAIIRNDSLYMGLMPLYTRYASLLVENAVSLRISDINLRALLTMGAPDDKTKASAELYLKRLEDGENAVIGETAFFDGVNYHDAKHPNNHMKDLIEYEQYLKASWFNEIGLDANYNMKRERISNGEVNQNSDALIPLIQNMYNSRVECIENVNKCFGLDISVELTSIWETNFNETLNPESETETENDDVSTRLENEYNYINGKGVKENDNTNETK